MIAAVVPECGVGGTLMLLEGATAAWTCDLLGCLNAFAADYFARQRVAGTHLNPSVFRQVPVLAPETFEIRHKWMSGVSLGEWTGARALELCYTAWDLEPFARDCGWSGPPFRWEEERRFLLRCELDAAFFHLYLPAEANREWKIARKADGCPYDETAEQLAELKRDFPTPRDAVAYIMDTFPIVKRKDEEKFGKYRTKDTILKIYDELAESQRTGHPFVSPLNPPPGPPTDEHGHFIPMSQWDPNHWPSHIHPPREAKL